MSDFQLTDDELEELANQVDDKVRTLFKVRGAGQTAYVRGDNNAQNDNDANDVTETQKEEFVKVATDAGMDGARWWTRIVEAAHREVCLPDGKFHERVHRLREPPPTIEIIVLITATLTAESADHRAAHFQLLCYTAAVWMVFTLADRGVTGFCKDCAPSV